MGHVDHGKTSLLDAIRSADVASGEAGGITQHIGAYEVTLESGNKVVFLDTPGHEAFTSMRARGASVTDIVIIVVAADDGVMAQTREAIDHSNAAGVPIIIAVNKIDKPGADPDRVKRELSELGLVPEDWGGDTIFVEVSAKEGTGIDELLELMTLQAELLELSAIYDRSAKGHVIESRLDKGRGAVATLLVQEGTLRVGDALVCGIHHGKVRAMLNDRGERVESAGPSIPVEIQGLSGVPEAGNEFVVLPDEKKAREVANYRQAKAREAELVKSNRVSLDSLFQKMMEAELKSIKLLIKADVQGSLEALNDALVKLSTEKIKVEIVRGGIGAITESDVLLASASEAIIIGFNVKPGIQARQLAEQEHVDIRFYDVIYHALEEIKGAMTGLLEPVFKETELGRAEVRETFHISKVGTIAGCHVVEGVIRRNAKVRLLRDNVVVFNGDIKSLKRFKDDAREVQAGYECGIGLERFNDIKTGDIIEAYELEEVAPDLGKSLHEQGAAGGGKDGAGGD
jgi:translation initiation factor IF-2